MASNIHTRYQRNLINCRFCGKIFILIFILCVITPFLCSKSQENDYPPVVINEVGRNNPLSSSWPANGIPICTDGTNQIVPKMCGDGAGGVIIAWFDNRAGFVDWDVYVQRVNSSGTPQWTPNGKVIADRSSIQGSPDCIAICEDGTGGAIIAWIHTMMEPLLATIVCAQRINASGSLLWTTNGIDICSQYGNNYPQVSSDGIGGAFITWMNYNEGKHKDQILAQRINASGDLQWPSPGILLRPSSFGQSGPQMSSDGEGGFIVAWMEEQNFEGSTYFPYAQRINSTGNVQWDNGVRLCTSETAFMNPWLQVCSDGAGGAIFSWTAERVPMEQILTQRVNASGSIQWPADGLCLSNPAHSVQYPRLCSDGLNGAFIVWMDVWEYTTLNAQCVNESGDCLWGTYGVETLVADIFGPHVIASDGAGGVAIISIASPPFGILAQKVNQSGNPLWGINGVMLHTPQGGHDIQDLQIYGDGTGHVTIAWRDLPSQSYIGDIYALGISQPIPEWNRALLPPADYVYFSNPVLNLAFTDPICLDRGWYTIDDQSMGTPNLFTNLITRSWTNTAWSMNPSIWASLEDGRHTIYFMVQNRWGNIEGDQMEWNWTFCKNYKPHASIHIDGNNQLVTFSEKVGTGTLSSPYIIQNLTIISSGTSPIWISNVNLPLVILRCFITSRYLNSGILLYNCTNVKVVNCTIQGNTVGLETGSCNSATISGNKIYDNTDSGIVISACSNIRLTGNMVYNNLNSGITASGTNIVVLENTFFNNVGGVVVGGNHLLVQNNNASRNQMYGIRANTSYSGTNKTIINNICNDNLGSGISTGGDFYNITMNTCKFNLKNGISIDFARNDSVSGNNCSYNARYGIELDYSENNRVFNNIIHQNTLGGILDNTPSHNIVFNNDIYQPTIPSKPIALQITKGNTHVVLSWLPPVDNGDLPITNYTIYRGTAPGSEIILVTIGNVLNYTDTSLVNGQTYYYVVTASNTAGESSISNEASITLDISPESEPNIDPIDRYIAIGAAMFGVLVVGISVVFYRQNSKLLTKVSREIEGLSKKIEIKEGGIALIDRVPTANDMSLTQGDLKTPSDDKMKPNNA